MSEEKEESILIEEDGIPKFKVIITPYWDLLQGIEWILFILLLVIVPHESFEHWELWIVHILINLYIYYKRQILRR